MAEKHKILVPKILTSQVREYRSLVRRQKISEAIGMALTILIVGFLVVFVVDRLRDAPGWFRGILFVVGLLGMMAIPLAIYRWIVQLQSLESVARLLSTKLPSVGDSLLGALELSSNAVEQNRSPMLCQAALEQVAASTAQRNLLEHTPNSSHRIWLSVASLLGIGGIALAVWFPQATWNAWQRYLLPFASIDRFTFTSLESVPKKLIVPYGEEFDVHLRLASHSQWIPEKGFARLGKLPDIEGSLEDGGYGFSIPAQLQDSELNISVGDASPTIDVSPAMRPELQKLSVSIQLPAYLQIADPLEKDIRGGAVTVVKQSKLHFQSQTTKAIDFATANGQPLPVRDGAFALPDFEVVDSQKIELRWKDTDGLEAKAPFPLMVNAIDDEAPTVFGDGLPKVRVVLDSEQLQFTLRALDDFGVKQVGLEWKTLESSPSIESEHGEFMLAKGGPSAQSLDAIATFQATAMKIPTRPVEVRLFAEDYLDGRGRVYSSPHTLYVLNPNDHAVWMLDQITKWQRESLEVRDRELQLLAGNKQLRDLSEEELNQPETRQKIEQQAAAEQSNGRRLNNLTAKGEELLRQAARNSEIGVGHLEKWAEMQRILKEIAANRMPSVANLLKKAANQKRLIKSDASSSSSSESKESLQVGNNQLTQSPPPGSSEEKKEEKENAPSISDQESSQQPVDGSKQADSKPTPNSPSAFRLPTTTLMGTGAKSPQSPEKDQEESGDRSLEEAVEKQEELIAEFQKVADELDELMGNLEGSTLVKRLKAASREQIEIADATNHELPDAFGLSNRALKSEQRMRVEDLGLRETKAIDFVSLIIDDMQGFHERRPSEKFESVLSEIKAEDIIGGLRGLSERIVEQQGIAIAEAEYWSDTLDRWAEDIVDPASKGECKGSKSKSSLPPSIVLEVLQVLESEMNLRDRTRVAEQAKEASSDREYSAKVEELVASQQKLDERIVAVGKKISELPDADTEFHQEIALMTQVSVVMRDAAEILNRPNTGKAAVAAETEAIELLLQAKRINPKSGGGGGSNPGGGGGGSTDDPAIAMIGPGVNQNEQRQDHGVSQQTGTTGTGLPEEYRYGLDEYFQRIDRKSLP